MLVWDTKGEWARWSDCRAVWSFDYLAECVKPGAPARRIAYQPTKFDALEFSTFCRLAHVAIRSHPRRLTLIVEELADVTTPGKAPAAWGVIVRRDLCYGPEIYAVTQRPSESDKTIMGNASVIHTHAMARAEDARYMAKELRVDQALIDALNPYEFLERDMGTKEITRGDPRGRRQKL